MRVIFKKGGNKVRCTQKWTGTTKKYMAKEVFIGQPYGLPADVYSFALVLYEVASLEQPFMEMSLDELSNKVHARVQP